MGKPKNVLNMDRLLSTVVTGITTDMRDVVGGFKQIACWFSEPKCSDQHFVDAAVGPTAGSHCSSKICLITGGYSTQQQTLLKILCEEKRFESCPHVVSCLVPCAAVDLFSA